jgi:hypothetical protein
VSPIYTTDSGTTVPACLDGNLATYCSTAVNLHIAPHIALVYAQPVRFLEIKITNRLLKTTSKVVVICFQQTCNANFLLVQMMAV